MRLRVPNDAVSAAGRAAHEIGLAAILGGNLFGRIAMHPALRRVGEPRERGAVVTQAWRRYGVVNGLALGGLVAGWATARAGEASDRYLTPQERSLARAKDVAVGALALTGTAAALEGMRFKGLEPGGGVPLADGNEAAPEATQAEFRAKRRLNALGAANLAAALGLAAINTAIAQASYRRPPKRRAFVRRW
jgi:hypothetical protein